MSHTKWTPIFKATSHFRGEYWDIKTDKRLVAEVYSEANAKRICQMNNSFDELVEACDSARKVLGLTMGDEGTGYDKLLREAQMKIEHALAKVGE